MDRARLTASLRDTTLSPESIEKLCAEPWRYGFLNVLRRLGADPHMPSIGCARRPRAEPFRLGQQPSLAFAPREIAEIGASNGRLKIRLFGLGMLGPNGPLPIHVTEIARDRKESRHDSTLVDFLDIFHHRYLTLFYRAWSSAQAAAGLDRPDDERFSFYVASLFGQKPDEIAKGKLPGHARMAASTHLVREARNPDGLRATLAQFFGAQVIIDEYVWQWIEVEPTEQSKLGTPGAPSVMGDGAMLGERVPDRQHKFRIVVGPLELDQYLRFTPQGADLPVLVEWVRAFVGYEFAWELELRIKAHSAPPAAIGGSERLGWSGWLGRSPVDAPITGMRFEPENYLFANH